MKKLSKMAALCVVATLVLASCSSDNGGTTNPPADKNYFPLAAGNSWTYDGVETENKSGTVTDVAGSSYTTTTVVDAALTYEGRSAYRLVSTMSDESKDRITIEDINITMEVNTSQLAIQQQEPKESREQDVPTTWI